VKRSLFIFIVAVVSFGLGFLICDYVAKDKCIKNRSERAHFFPKLKIPFGTLCEVDGLKIIDVPGNPLNKCPQSYSLLEIGKMNGRKFEEPVRLKFVLDDQLDKTFEKRFLSIKKAKQLGQYILIGYEEYSDDSFPVYPMISRRIEGPSFKFHIIGLKKK
jgi:hypothetical protein